MRIEFSEVKITATFLINEQKVCLARLRSANYSRRDQLHFQLRRVRANHTKNHFAQTKAHRCITNNGGSLRHMRTDRAFERLKSSSFTTFDNT